MLGGHLHPDAPVSHPSLSVAILGSAKKLIRSHLADPGDHLILAVDLDGKRGCKSVVSWDANSGKTPQELRYRLEILPMIAENDLSCAGKDISNAGILGTISIFLENSGKGGTIDLQAIPRPDSIALNDWLHCFQSFGFILSVKPEHSTEVIERFRERTITAAVVGAVDTTEKVMITSDDASGVLFDFSNDEITGIRYPGPPNAQ